MVSSLNIAAAQTVLNLAADGSSQAEPDQITASLTAQFSSGGAASAQAKVNSAMAQALAKAKAVSGVTATTGDYSVYQTAPSDSAQPPVYQASQTLQLVMQAPQGAPQGAPPGAFTALVGELQEKGLLLNSLNGDLSPKAQAAAEQSAILDAIRQIQVQAKAVASVLNEQIGKFQVLNVNVNAPGPMPRVGPMMMMAQTAAPPLAAPAKITVQASVSATLSLTPPP